MTQNRLKPSGTDNCKLILDEERFTAVIEFKDEWLNTVYNQFSEEAKECISRFLNAALGVLYMPHQKKPEMWKNFDEMVLANLEIIKRERTNPSTSH